MNIFEFNCYKEIITHLMGQKSKGGRGELAKISKFLNVHSSLISQVMSGSKEFSIEQMLGVTQYFELNESESEFLVFILERERAGTQALKKFWQYRIDRARKDSKDLAKRLKKADGLNSEDAAVFYSSWLYSAVRIFTSIDNGKTEKEILTRFGSNKLKLREVLDFLERVRLVVKEGDKYKIGPRVTHLSSGSPFLPKHTSNWRLRAITKSESVDKDEILYSGPMSISRKDFLQLKEEIVQFIKNFTKRVENTEPEELACFNIDLFWLSEKPD